MRSILQVPYAVSHIAILPVPVIYKQQVSNEKSTIILYCM